MTSPAGLRLGRRLVDHIPPDQRTAVLTQLCDSLVDQRCDDASISTTELASVLLETAEDAGRLVLFVITSIADGPAPQLLARLAAVSYDNEYLRRLVLVKIKQRLAQHLARLVQRCGSEGFISPPKAVLEYCPAGFESDDVSSDSVTGYLRFLQHYFRHHPESLLESTCLLLPLALVGSDRHCSQAGECLRTALSLLENIGDISSLVPHLSDTLWSQVQNLAALPNSATVQTSILHIWLRWTTLPEGLGPSQETLASPRYWQLIRHALVHGLSEQRKVCLLVFRCSLSLISRNIRTPGFRFDISCRERYQSQYLKICNIFETLVLSQYFVQAKAALPELNKLASPAGVVPIAWIISLLCACLGPSQAENVRNLAARWYMSLDISENIDEHAHFLQNALLPWASNGRLFTPGIRAAGKSFRCYHGQALRRFLTKTLGNVDDDDRQSIARAVLNFTDQWSGFVYVIPYIMSGLSSGLDGRKCLGAEEARALANIAQKPGLPHVVRDLVTCLCNEILNCVRGDEADAAVLRRNYADLSLPAVQGDDSVDNFEALQRLWADIERHMYPKDLVIRLPQVVLQPEWLTAAASDHELRGLLRTISQYLFGTLSDRSYLVAPLMQAVRRLSLLGVDTSCVFSRNDLVLDICNNPPEERPEVSLERLCAEELQAKIPHRDFDFYNGKGLEYGFTAFFDMLNRMGGSDAESILRTLLGPWANQKPSRTCIRKWKNVVQLQAMLTLVDPALSVMQSDQILQVLQGLLKAVAEEQLPKYRYILECIILRIHRANPGTQDSLLDLMDVANHDLTGGRVLASAIRISVQVAHIPDCGVVFTERLFALLLPLLTSAKVAVRHEAQWAFPTLWDLAMSAGMTRITSAPGYSNVNAHIRSLEKFQKPPIGAVWHIGHGPMQEHSLSAIFEGDYLRLDPTELKTATRRGFVDLWRDDQESGSNLDSIAPPRIPLGTLGSGPEVDFTDPQPKELTPDATANSYREIERSTLPIQMKSNAWQDALLQDRRSSPVILVASLIENAHNLGGLSRCGEIFGCDRLVLASRRVVEQAAFVAVAVSSHHHLPMEEVTADALPEHLRRLKLEEGYRIVGIEQTDRSVVLGSDAIQSKFPARTAFVLGSEVSGISARVLAECEVCVEIKQMGVTRSLNVQTAASIVLYEYSRQHS